MAEIFISYRRDDGQASAGRLNDRLVKTFGQHEIFMDVDAIAYGEDFVSAIEQAVSKCDALIVVIGRNWLNLTDKNGRRRLDDPKDFVRIEVRAALERNIRVIPVLVENAQLPSENELPDDLKPLVRRNAIELRHTSFDSDSQRLIKTLSDLPAFKDVREKINGGGRKKIGLIAFIAIVIISILVSVYFFTGNRQKDPPSDGGQFMLKVRIVGSDKPTQSFNEGNIILYAGKEPKKDDIHNGEVTFYNIPDQYNNKKVKIETLIPGYKADDTGDVLISRDKDYVDIKVSRTVESLNTEIRGSVINEKNAPVRNALINIAGGLATCYTDQNGDFKVSVPLASGERTRMKVTVNNITLYNEDVVLSSTTPINLKIDLTP